MKNSCFMQLTEEERTEKLVRTIRTRTGDLLNTAEIAAIKQIDTNKQYGIKVVYTAADFVAAVMLKNIYDNGKKTVEIGVPLFGEFNFGQQKAGYVKKQFTGGVIKRACLNETSKAAAAVIHTSNIGYEDLSIPYEEDNIVIYVPYAMQKVG